MTDEPNVDLGDREVAPRNEILRTEVPVDGAPVVKDIAGDLNSLQAEVGGWIEAVATEAEDISVYCNEEGKIEGLPVNPNTDAIQALEIVLSPGDFIVGPLVVTGFDPETGEQEDVPEAALAKVGLA
ncbi:MAG: DUF3846 domain-containing protein [Tetrasphaera jenkinsii]|jgi:hypothetical protein|nr:DUF3846 domain-containing protein [Tetrasphaera jenkinsii]